MFVKINPPSFGATPLSLRFHLQATLNPTKPFCFVTLTPFKNQETPDDKQK